jgi:hypothetical protein
MIGNKRQREDSPLRSMVEAQGVYKFDADDEIAAGLGPRIGEKRMKKQVQSDLDNFADIVNTVLEEVDLKKNPRKKNEETVMETSTMRMRFT